MCEERKDMTEMPGLNVSSDNIISIILESAEKWKIKIDFISKILRYKSELWVEYSSNCDITNITGLETGPGLK